MEYITLEMLKHHLYIDHDLDDFLLTMMASTAEDVIINYITKSPYLNEEQTIVRTPVIAAIAIYVGILYRNRDSDNFGRLSERQLPQSITSLLASLRSPTIV